MKLPCEKAIWYTLPQIRADLARELVNKGLSQKDAAAKLGITSSAVSQYVHKKRAGKTKTSAAYKKRITQAAEEIINSQNDEETSKIICLCCNMSRT